jgi:hypothetical protein
MVAKNAISASSETSTGSNLTNYNKLWKILPYHWSSDTKSFEVKFRTNPGI